MSGEENRDFSISYMNRQEVYATASNMGADYILVEQADGRFTLDTAAHNTPETPIPSGVLWPDRTGAMHLALK